jgi:ribonuclease VapC
MMSTVNLSEMLILLRDRNPSGYRALSDRLVGEPIRFIPPTISQAQLAAEARSKFPLNLGDCFAYALAKEEGEPLITLDRDFKRTDIKVLLPVR